MVLFKHVTAEIQKLYCADDKRSCGPILSTMASQRDLFDVSQNDEGDEALGEADLPEECEGDVEEDFGAEQANDYDPKTKRTVKFQDAELGILIDHLDRNLQNLMGHIKNNEYRRGRRQAWRNLVDAINNWNAANGTGVIRSAKSIKTRLDNLKYRSKCNCIKMRRSL